MNTIWQVFAVNARTDDSAIRLLVYTSITFVKYAIKYFSQRRGNNLKHIEKNRIKLTDFELFWQHTLLDLCSHRKFMI